MHRLAFALLALLVARSATAQQNPPGEGDGGGSGPGAGGVSAGQVPLALPEERDGLPVPVAVVGTGGNHMGAVGPGWDVPLSTVTINRTFSRSRPRFTAADEPPTLRDPGPVVTVGGERIPFLWASNDLFRARLGHPAMELRWIAAGSAWELHDGGGVRYRFERLPGLGEGWPWFLVEVAGQRHAGSVVRLSYESTGGDHPEILLTQVRYNHDAAGTCAKHTVSLAYADLGLVPEPTGQPTPPGPLLGTAVVDGKVVTRTRALVQIDVTARGTGCATSAARLARYRFRYAPDADTGARRLIAVDTSGRPGMPAGDTWRPVQRWVYGRATSTTAGYPQVTYARKPSLPIDDWAGLRFGDVDGDGLLDLVSQDHWERNIGGAAFGPIQLLSPSVHLPAPGEVVTTGERGTYRPTPAPAVEELTSEDIDFNGDGRIDRLAIGRPDTWTLYLNEPTGWRVVGLNVGNVRAGLAALGHDVSPAHLALNRTVTGYGYEDMGCRVRSGSSWIPCAGSVAVYTYVGSPESTRTEWKIADVNGDGYPDVVATTRQARVIQTSGSECDDLEDGGAQIFVDPEIWGPWPGPGSDPRRVCRLGGWSFPWVQPGSAPGTFEGVSQTELVVFYNRAGVQLGTGASPFADGVVLANSLGPYGLGIWGAWVTDTRPFSELLPSGLYRVFHGFVAERTYEAGGLLDVTGDGLADLLGPGSTRVGTGTGFVEVGLSLPSIVRETYSNVWQCGHDPAHPPLVARTIAGYVDVNGDGILDYLDRDNVRFGSGASLSSGTTIASPEPWLLSERTGSCFHPGGVAVTAGLWDLDGDGRPELVRGGHETVDVVALHEPDSGWGAPASGQIVEIDNGYGAVTHLRYASQKSDLTTQHMVPFPEIQLVERSVTRRGGAPSEAILPTRYAYGGARLWFDHAADRWIFPGYDREVSISGTPGDKGLDGQAVITDALRPTDLAGYQRNVLLGQPRTTARLAGSIPDDPRALLLVEPHNHGAWRGTETYTRDTRTVALEGFTPDDCALAPQPYEGLGAVLDRTCRLIGFPFVAKVNRRDGRGAFFLARFTETETEVVDIDGFGRPRLIRHAGDVFKTDDDLCEDRRYAAPVTAAWPVRGALAARWLREPVPNGPQAPLCSVNAQALAGVRFRYDHLPEGVVGVGRLTDDIVERRDGFGQLLDQWTAATRWFDAAGNVTRIDEESGTHVELGEWDAFGLRAATRTVIAPDVPSPFVERSQVDPYTLVVTQRTFPDGRIARVEHDGLGRAIQGSWVDAQDHIEYIASRVDYQGDTVVVPVGPPSASAPPVSDAYDPLGRRSLVRIWEDTVPLADAPTNATLPTKAERWTYRSLDFLGRPRREEVLLGEDYGGARVVSSHLEYDALGRVAFSADPHVSTIAALAGFGTSYRYDPDGSVRCAIRARGFQIDEHTSLADSRFVSCSSTSYQQGTRVLSLRGPLENDPTSEVADAADLTVFDGAGRIVRRSRVDGSTVLERMDLVADRLGRTALTLRHKDAAAATGGPLWITSHDSLGQVVLYDEPGSAVRNAVYDRAGHLLELWWLDGPVRHSVGHRYDGLGRTIATSEVTGGFEDPASVVDFFYDVPSGDAIDPPPGPSRGKITHAHSATQSVYFGYDGRGRTAFTSWQDDQAEPVHREVRYRADGRLREVRYRLPDTEYRDEIARYEYDSAQRLRQVTWQDEVFTKPLTLLDIKGIDPYGRPRDVRFGNGATLDVEYRDSERDELLSTTLSTADDSLATSFTYDAELRIVSRREESAKRDEVSTFHYDAAGRLDRAAVVDGSGTLWDDAYAYDGLGNRTALVDSVGDRSQTLRFDSLDADRLCAVEGSGFPERKGCQFRYDALGNVVEAPRSPGVSLLLDHDNRGRIRRSEIAPAGAVAEWSYGPFGSVASLSISGGGAPRRDLRYGDAAARLVLDGEKVYERQIPGPDEVLATKRGSGGHARFLYWHRDRNGNRAFSDQDGRLVEEVVYAPFGETRRSTGTPGTLDHTTFQWNEGDDLPDLGVTQLGPRLYDARLGRFLERDPLVAPFSAAKATPYGFAWNDPVNRRDPSGLCTEGDPDSCDEDALGVLVGLGGSYLADGLGNLASSILGSAGSSRAPVSPFPAREFAGFMAHVLGVDLVPARYWQFNMRLPDQGMLDGGGPGALCGSRDGHMRMACQASRNVEGLPPYTGPDYQMVSDAAIMKGFEFWTAVFTELAGAGTSLPDMNLGAGRGVKNGVGAIGRARLPSGEPVPHGFLDAQDFADFGEHVRNGTAGAGFTDVDPVLRGSSVTGVGFTSGKPFGPGTDLDVALVSPQMFERAKELKVELRQGRTRTAPLKNYQLDQLGLRQLQDTLTYLAGRPVTFMIYADIDAVIARGTPWVPF